MKIAQFLLIFFSSFALAEENSDNSGEFYNSADSSTLFVQNWQEISQSIIEEIEKINQMNESSYNRLPEKQFIELINKSVQSYPNTLLNLQKKKETEAGLALAKSSLFPNINIGAGSGEQSTEYPTGTIDGSQDRLSLSFSQLIFDFKQTKLNIAAANKKITSAELSENAARLDNCMLAIQNYLEYYRASSLLSLGLKQAESAKSLVLMLSEKEKLGGTSQHEISRARIKYAEALNKIPVLEQNLLVTKNKYEMFFADTSINPSGIFFPVEPNIDVMQNEDFNSIYENYPVVKSTREAIETAILEIDALSRAKFGGFFLEGSTSKVAGSLSTSAQDSQSIMLIYRSNVFSGGAHRAKVDEAKARLAQQKIQLEQLKKDYLLAFNQSKSNYLKEQKTFLSTKEIVDQSMQSFKGTLELFFARKGGLLDVFSIQESIFSAGSLMVNSFVNKTLAKYRYMHVTGQLLDYIYPKI